MKVNPNRARRVIGGVPQFTRENRDELIAIAMRNTQAVDGKPEGIWLDASELLTRQYHILLLAYAMEMSDSKIAEVLGSKQTTIAYHHRQALTALREGIEANK